MVPYNTEHSFIVAGSFLWEELDDDSGLRVWFDGALSLGEGKNVGLVAVELEGGGLVAVIDDVQ